jgi:hypothetical protein
MGRMTTSFIVFGVNLGIFRFGITLEDGEKNQ